MFMKSALVQQMRMRSQMDRDKDSDSAASRFDRNLKNLQGSFGSGAKQAMQGMKSEIGRGSLGLKGTVNKETGFERNRLDRTGGEIMIAQI